MAAELKMARAAGEAGNDGKMRVCARRATGLVTAAFNQSGGAKAITGNAALQRLKHVADREDFPDEVRRAARRLTVNVNQRLSSNFSFNPLQDAEVIIAYFSARMDSGAVAAE